MVSRPAVANPLARNLSTSTRSTPLTVATRPNAIRSKSTQPEGQEGEHKSHATPRNPNADRSDWRTMVGGLIMIGGVYFAYRMFLDNDSN